MDEVATARVTVSQLATTPVKGMRLQQPTQVRLDRRGVVGDREFLVVDRDNRLLPSTRTPDLLRVEPSWDAEGGVLALRFPDGSLVSDTPVSGVAAVTYMWDGRELAGRLVEGPLATALSEYLHRPVRLLRREPDQLGNDTHAATVMSEASLGALAPELGGTAPDPRRFRMTITITGIDAWVEYGWAGRKVDVGEVSLRVLAPVPRCVVTTHNPESGVTDARVLHALARLHGKDDMTFGVWCDVARPGLVRRGDPVTLHSA